MTTANPGNHTPAQNTVGSSPRRGGVLGTVLLAVGVVISIVGAGVLAGGILMASSLQLADNEGYLSVPTETFTTQTYALMSPDVGELTIAPAGVQNLPFDLITLRLTATSTDSDVFIGIAPRADLDNYLDGVERTEIINLRYFPFEVEYRDVPGTRAPAPPVEQNFWVESATGSGTQEVQWSVAPGEWGVVVMNADGSPDVTVDMQTAVRSDLIGPIATVLIIISAVLLLIGIAMIIGGAVRLGRRLPSDREAAPAPVSTSTAARSAVSPAAAPAETTRAYPSRLEGVRDENLSRWLWLVKWLLAIPHYLILVFLWVAFAFTTVIAGFAILFTGRYPRPLFTFNVGVLRWSWRVGFYSYSALGTDKYPPFTLAQTDYPADFDIAYPHQLSRGMVLVKWWILVIPHYLILAAISGPMAFWCFDWNSHTGRTGISVIAVLILIAAVALLFTSRYPSGLFNLVMGINRWIYRVITYAALFRDEYPPFRLDQGAHEPSTQGDDPSVRKE